MVRLPKEASNADGGSGWLIIVVLWGLAFLAAVMFTCAQGLSKDDNKSQPEQFDSTLYAGGECGAACGC